MIIIAIFIALLLDWLIGDPYSWPHPVKLIGNFIYACLRMENLKTRYPFLFGIFLWLCTVSLTVSITYGILWGASQLHPKARYQVGMIVGRETDQLTIPEICNATIETVAENASDGVIGPLLCLFIGGPVFAMGYKAINTLDSMVGYKTAKYRKIGYVSAKIDDLVNLIPARLTWLFMMASARILQLNFVNAIKIGWRDRYQHASPNSAFPESVVAGALGIQLGGAHIYHGELITKPTIGDPTRSVEPDDILSSISILYMTTTVSVFVLSIIYFIVAIY